MVKLNARLALAYEKFDQPMTVIGQSLGGVYARECDQRPSVYSRR